jgi:NAD+ synthase
MRPELKEEAADIVKDFIASKVRESGGHGVVLGLSGGVDSALVAKLCADAVGKEKVLAIFLPTKSTSSKDRADVERYAAELGVELVVQEIDPIVDAFSNTVPYMDSKELLGNVMARVRMVILFHYAKVMQRVVMGTSNKSELLMGYFTKFGDGGADFAPIGDLYKTEVWALARKVGVPDYIVDKTPSAGLWPGQTDEGEMGISYANLDRILMGIEMSFPIEEIAKRTGMAQKTVEEVWVKHRHSVHKRKMPLIPKVGIRTVGLDWRE